MGSIMAKISTMSEINDCLRGVVCGCHYRSDLLPGSAFNGALNPCLCVVEVVIRTVKPAVPAAVAHAGFSCPGHGEGEMILGFTHLIADGLHEPSEICGVVSNACRFPDISPHLLLPGLTIMLLFPFKPRNATIRLWTQDNRNTEAQGEIIRDVSCLGKGFHGIAVFMRPIQRISALHDVVVVMLRIDMCADRTGIVIKILPAEFPSNLMDKPRVDLVTEFLFPREGHYPHIGGSGFLFLLILLVHDFPGIGIAIYGGFLIVDHLSFVIKKRLAILANYCSHRAFCFCKACMFLMAVHVVQATAPFEVDLCQIRVAMMAGDKDIHIAVCADMGLIRVDRVGKDTGEIEVWEIGLFVYITLKWCGTEIVLL